MFTAACADDAAAVYAAECVRDALQCDIALRHELLEEIFRPATFPVVTAGAATLVGVGVQLATAAKDADKQERGLVMLARMYKQNPAESGAHYMLACRQLAGHAASENVQISAIAALKGLKAAGVSIHPS